MQRLGGSLAALGHALVAGRPELPRPRLHPYGNPSWVSGMSKTRIMVQQIGSPVRWHHKRRETLIGLKLNRIGRFAELPDTLQTRGMIAKVAHLVRVLYVPTELDYFIEVVRAEYHQPITTRILRGDLLWAQFGEAVASCRSDPKGDDRQITEKVNELAVAKVLLDDATITGPITYEPDFLPDGRKIDFAWHQSNLEDFADFYLTGIHRGDDAFALVEQHAIREKEIKFLRNIDHFAYLRRHIEKPQKEDLHFPIRGPRFNLPLPKPLEP
jgi:large subunit ribosomal protein L30